MSLSVNIKNAGYKNKPVLSDLNFTLEKGSFTAVIGRNGSGKSTLISALGGLLKFKGDMISDGVSLKELDRKERAKKLSAMLQSLKTPHITVKELVAFGRNPYVSLNKPLSESDLVTINKANNAKISNTTNLNEFTGGGFGASAQFTLTVDNIINRNFTLPIPETQYELKFATLPLE